MTRIRSLAIRRGLLWGAAVVVWACGSATEVDRSGRGFHLRPSSSLRRRAPWRLAPRYRCKQPCRTPRERS